MKSFSGGLFAGHIPMGSAPRPAPAAARERRAHDATRATMIPNRVHRKASGLNLIKRSGAIELGPGINRTGGYAADERPLNSIDRTRRRNTRRAGRTNAVGLIVKVPPIPADCFYLKHARVFKMQVLQRASDRPQTNHGAKGKRLIVLRQP
jgi:hypothetical protein